MIRLVLWLGVACAAWSQDATNVLLVVNRASPLSVQIAEYYTGRRHIPASNVCPLSVSPSEEVARDEFQQKIADPIAAFLRAKGLEERILYIVTTAGLPLRIPGHGAGTSTETASVDSELALLYKDMHSGPHPTPSGIANPYFGKMNAPFRHPDFPIYLVTRLAGYDFDDVKGIVDRALRARNRGKFVLDLRAGSDEGNNWLLEAARALPQDRVVLERSDKVLYDQTGVIAYASWGSNDPARKQRHLGFEWLPGAIATEYVSTNGRTFARPPDNWAFGSWSDPKAFFEGSPQSLTADYIHDGATGASGHVAEPFLQFTPRPNLLLPAYYQGRNLAESYYLSIPALSWMNIIIGDPLCTLGKP